MTRGTSDSIAAAAAVIALFSLSFSLVQYLRARHEEIIRSLQGSKESVGYIAFKLSEGKFPKRASRRKEILTSLCLAAIFEGSGRSRTLLYMALRRAMETYRVEVIAIIGPLEKHFLQSWVGAPELEKGKKRLKQLRQALDLDEVDAAGQAQPVSHDEDKASSN